MACPPPPRPPPRSLCSRLTMSNGRLARTLLRDVQRLVRRYAPPLSVAGFLALALGYVVLHSVFPNVTIPSEGEASGLLTIGLLVLPGFVAGLVTEDVRAGILQIFVSIPLGILIASVLALSPVMTGVLVVQADELVIFVLRLGFPIYLIAVPLYTMVGIAGMLLR